MRLTSMLTCLLASVCAGSALAPLAAAQDQTGNYPNQTIRIVVPFSAGGATDITARIVAQKMTEDLKATIVIENKPGATGALAAEHVAKAQPDGYTLFMGTGSVNSVNPAVKKSLRFDTLRDFAPVSNFFTTPNILVVHPSVPAQTVAEFITLLASR
jgi:tripartite-type tricarboxylate transporter receptor subunit TctC